MRVMAPVRSATLVAAGILLIIGSVLIVPVPFGSLRSATAATAPLRVSCPDIGQVVLAAPPAVGGQPAIPDDGVLRVHVSYTATDLRTGRSVRAGAPAPTGVTDCGTRPFTARPASQVASGSLPAGVAPSDPLTGQYSISVEVLALPGSPAPTTAPRLALASQQFPNDAQLSSYLAGRPGSKAVALFDAATNATYVNAPS